MVDLIVPAGTVLKIDQPSQVGPQYRLFRMEANAKIVTSIDLTIKASRAEFADGCVIDASGAAGANGSNGVAATVNFANGGLGANGLSGQHGHNVAIEAGLAIIGGLTISTDGGAGGRGGTGGIGGPGGHVQIPGAGGLVDLAPGSGGDGGAGAPGGDAGQISIAWMPLAANLPSASGKSPQGHIYRSNGGLGGTGGTGGAGGSGGPASRPQGSPGNNGVTAANGKSLAAQIRWWPNPVALLWVQKQDMGPGPRAYHDIAFDPKRNRLVLFGGLVTGKPTGDTWEWDGRFWTQVADTGPVPRAYHAMAYDAAGQRILLFGGSDGGSVTAGAQDRVYRSDTWAWDGQDWVQLSDAGPSARQSHAMACDASRSRVVLFSGGQISAQATNVAAADTWEWDGVEWAQVADTGPSARLGAKLANVQDGVLLFGGAGAGPAPGETWRWDGRHWLQVADTGPAPRTGHAIASDGLAVVLFGGERLVASDSRNVNDTWAWYDQTWRQIQDIGPSPRMAPSRGCARQGSLKGKMGQRIALGKPHRSAEFPRRDVDQHQVHRPPRIRTAARRFPICCSLRTIRSTKTGFTAPSIISFCTRRHSKRICRGAAASCLPFRMKCCSMMSRARILKARRKQTRWLGAARPLLVWLDTC